MDNIFKGAEFGDKYRAVDGRMAVFDAINETLEFLRINKSKV